MNVYNIWGFIWYFSCKCFINYLCKKEKRVRYMSAICQIYRYISDMWYGPEAAIMSVYMVDMNIWLWKWY